MQEPQASTRCSTTIANERPPSDSRRSPTDHAAQRRPRSIAANIVERRNAGRMNAGRRSNTNERADKDRHRASPICTNRDLTLPNTAIRASMCFLVVKGTVFLMTEGCRGCTCTPVPCFREWRGSDRCVMSSPAALVQIPRILDLPKDFPVQMRSPWAVILSCVYPHAEATAGADW